MLAVVGVLESFIQLEFVPAHSLSNPFMINDQMMSMSSNASSKQMVLNINSSSHTTSRFRPSSCFKPEHCHIVMFIPLNESGKAWGRL